VALQRASCLILKGMERAKRAKKAKRAKRD
jgi:hypothetical protein